MTAGPQLFRGHAPYDGHPTNDRLEHASYHDLQHRDPRLALGLRLGCLRDAARLARMRGMSMPDAPNQTTACESLCQGIEDSFAFGGVLVIMVTLVGLLVFFGVI